MYGEMIAKLRENKKLTQEELANKLGISRAALSHYEKCRREPDYATLKKIADYFEVTTDYLLGRSNVSTPADTIAQALSDDKELSIFWAELRQREDLQLLFKQTKDLSPATIKRIIKYIKMVEDEEAAED